MCVYTHPISNFLSKSLGYWQHKFASDSKIKGKPLLNISCLEVAADLCANNAKFGHVGRLDQNCKRKVRALSVTGFEWISIMFLENPVGMVKIE